MRGLFGLTKKSTFLKLIIVAVFAFVAVLMPWSNTAAFADEGSQDITFTFDDEAWDANGWGNSGGKTCSGITSNSNGDTLLVAGGTGEAYQIWITTSNHNEWKINAAGDIPAAGVEFQLYYQYVPEGQTNTEIFVKTVHVTGSGAGSVAIVAGVTGTNSDSINEVHACPASIVPPVVQSGTVTINKIVNDDDTDKIALPADATSIEFQFEVTINGVDGGDYSDTYSFDGGATWIDYAGPFTVKVSADQPVQITVPDSSQVSSVEVREIDDATDAYVFGGDNDVTKSWDSDGTMTFNPVNVYQPEICQYDDTLTADDPSCIEPACDPITDEACAGGKGGGPVEESYELTPAISVMDAPSTGYRVATQNSTERNPINSAIITAFSLLSLLIAGMALTRRLSVKE